MQYNTDVSASSAFYKCKKCRFHLFTKDSLIKHVKESDKKECDSAVFVDQTVDWLSDVVKEVEGKVSIGQFFIFID